MAAGVGGGEGGSFPKEQNNTAWTSEARNPGKSPPLPSCPEQNLTALQLATLCISQMGVKEERAYGISAS